MTSSVSACIAGSVERPVQSPTLIATLVHSVMVLSCVPASRCWKDRITIRRSAW